MWVAVGYEVELIWIIKLHTISKWSILQQDRLKKKLILKTRLTWHFKTKICGLKKKVAGIRLTQRRKFSIRFDKSEAWKSKWSRRNTSDEKREQLYDPELFVRLSLKSSFIIYSYLIFEHCVQGYLHTIWLNRLIHNIGRRQKIKVECIDRCKKILHFAPAKKTVLDICIARKNGERKKKHNFCR